MDLTTIKEVSFLNEAIRGYIIVVAGETCEGDCSEEFGNIYNWYAINDNRNVAPEGWHIPTDEEWMELEMFLGMSYEDAHDEGSRGTDEGFKLKETGYSHWLINDGATNSSGFTARAAGCRIFYPDLYDYLFIGYATYLWTATLNGNAAWARSMGGGSGTISRVNWGRQYGFSVRCVRDVD